MNKSQKEKIVVLLFGMFFLGGTEGLFSQVEKDKQVSAEQASLKQLLVKKFDANLDGNLAAFEQKKAVEFLNGMDANGDGQISLTERNKAIKVLGEMIDPSTKRESGKTTFSNRSKSKRLVKWQEFSKKLPHGAGARIFTNESMPGEEGFSVKGQKEADPADIKGDLDVPSQISSDELDKKLAMRKSERERKVRNARVPPVKVPKELVAAARKKRSYYDNTMILAKDGVHAVVPQGAILSIPPGLGKLVVKEPVGKLMRWPDFLKKYSDIVTTKEVSWETVKGGDPISEKEKKAFLIGGKVVVAVYRKSPVTVLDPPPETGVVAGAVVSDSNKKKK